MMVTVSSATMACTSVISTPKRRKMKTAMSVRKRKSITNDIARSRCVRFPFSLIPPATPFLLTASLKALPMTPEDLMMPMMPAMAMAPMPMGRT